MTTHTLSVSSRTSPASWLGSPALFSPARLQHRLPRGRPDRARGDLAHHDPRSTSRTLPLEQVTKQLNKLINVLKIVELDRDASVQRELLLVKVKADLASRSQVLEIVQLFRAKVVDVAGGRRDDRGHRHRDKLDALIRVLEPFGIRELVQSGMVAVGRGPAASPTVRCVPSRGL